MLSFVEAGNISALCGLLSFVGRFLHLAFFSVHLCPVQISSKKRSASVLCWLAEFDIQGDMCGRVDAALFIKLVRATNSNHDHPLTDSTFALFCDKNQCGNDMTM
jgi:hypothetical protein